MPKLTLFARISAIYGRKYVTEPMTVLFFLAFVKFCLFVE